MDGSFARRQQARESVHCRCCGSKTIKDVETKPSCKIITLLRIGISPHCSYHAGALSSESISWLLETEEKMYRLLVDSLLQFQMVYVEMREETAINSGLSILPWKACNLKFE